MSRKEECKKLMSKFFGPATADSVDKMTEENCIDISGIGNGEFKWFCGRDETG